MDECQNHPPATMATPTAALSLSYVVPCTDDYKEHTSCMTEAERYEKTLFRGNKTKKKKNPQEAWMDLLEEAANTAPPPLLPHMKRLASLDNVPRKEKQFRNFTANSLNLRGKRQSEIVGSLWKYLADKRQQNQQEKQQQQQESKQQQQQESKQQQEKPAPTTLSNNDDDDDKTRNALTTSLDASRPEPVPKEEDSVVAALTPKSVRKTIRKVLKKAPKKSMKMKKLRLAVQDALGLDPSAKKRLKKMLSNALGSSSSADSKHTIFKVDGKLVSLVIA